MNNKYIFLIAACLLFILIIVFTFENYRLSQKSSDIHDSISVVRVYPFKQHEKDEDIDWVSITTERKIIELLVKSGVTVLSPMIRTQTSREPDYHIKGRVYSQDTIITATILLHDKYGREVSSGELRGTGKFFRKIRNVIGETVVYALDIDQQNLQIGKTKKKPTISNSAYALFLKAKQKATAEQYDRAIRLLFQAVEQDTQFAMAYWAIAQLYRDQGVEDSSAIWDAKAKEINASHPKWPYRDSVDKEQPLKDLLSVSGKQPFKMIDKGILYKHIELKQHGLNVITWIIDLQLFTIDMQLQNKNTGNYITEFLTDQKTVLALNGGFFEMDKNYSLSPSGLIVKSGVVLSPITEHGGSGIFCIKNNKPEIVWAKDSINPADYTLAFQSGPVIVEPGGVMGVYNNSYRRLNRSAIGLAEGKVVLAIAIGKNGSGLSLYEFAEFLRLKKEDGGIGCDVVLNLDGGSSTQVCFVNKDVAVNIPGLWAINSAIVIKKME